MGFEYFVIIFLAPLVFAGLDYGFHFVGNYEVKIKEIKDQNDKLVLKRYHPNLRIWGLGAILSFNYILLSRLDAICFWLMNTNNPIGIVSGTVFFISWIGVMVFAIIKIVREEE